MPHATTERRLKQLIQAGWVYRRGRRYLLRLERLEEPTYAIYFTHAERSVAVAYKKLGNPAQHKHAQNGNLTVPRCVTVVF